jgi:2-keto-4-pentenoate hydratase
MHTRNAGQSSAQAEALARCLVDARLQGRVLDQYPGQLPTTIEQAYSVQAAAIARWPDEVVGWKVARLPVDDRERFAKERLAGPIYRSVVQTVEAGSEAVAHVFDGGFAAIEAEIVFELGCDVPADFHGGEEELAKLLAKVYCGAEIASSPMPFVIDLGAMSIISDMGINTGQVIGPEITDFLSVGPEALSVSVSVDGDVVGEANPGAITGAPFDALRFLIDHCNEFGIKLAKGALISTGMITGVHPVTLGCKSRVDFGSRGWFDVAFESIKCRQEPG